jgi:hypothetical protein
MTPTLSSFWKEEVKLKVLSALDDETNQVYSRLIVLYVSKPSSSLLKNSNSVQSASSSESITTTTTTTTATATATVITEEELEFYPVEIACISVRYEHFSEEVTKEIKAAKKPFGKILLDHQVQQFCFPFAFFCAELHLDQLSSLLGRDTSTSNSKSDKSNNSLDSTTTSSSSSSTINLFGRCNVIRNEKQQCLAEVLELIPSIPQQQQQQQRESDREKASLASPEERNAPLLKVSG